MYLSLGTGNAARDIQLRSLASSFKSGVATARVARVGAVRLGAVSWLRHCLTDDLTHRCTSYPHTSARPSLYDTLSNNLICIICLCITDNIFDFFRSRLVTSAVVSSVSIGFARLFGSTEGLHRGSHIVTSHLT